METYMITDESGERETSEEYKELREKQGAEVTTRARDVHTKTFNIADESGEREVAEEEFKKLQGNQHFVSPFGFEVSKEIPENVLSTLSSKHLTDA